MSVFLTSTEIAKILGVSVATVRRWANAGLLPAERTPGGHRRFSLDVAERLTRQKQAVEPQLDDWIRVLVSASGALSVDAALLAERSRRDGWFEVAQVLGRVLEELGVRWERGDLSIVEEHIASARLSRALARVADSLPARTGAPHVLLATAESEAHTLGLQLVELCMAEWGWRPTWIGRDTSTELLVRRVAARDAAVLVLSASVASVSTELHRVVQHLSGVCRREGIALVVGGSGSWPDALPHGTVIRDFRALRGWMGQFDVAHRRAGV